MCFSLPLNPTHQILSSFDNKINAYLNWRSGYYINNIKKQKTYLKIFCPHINSNE
jgi:hypothetical protein